jgi:hypothetical protein
LFFVIETVFSDVAGAVDDPLDPHTLRDGGIGLGLFGDPLAMGQQLTDKAGGPVRCGLSLAM